MSRGVCACVMSQEEGCGRRTRNGSVKPNKQQKVGWLVWIFRCLVGFLVDCVSCKLAEFVTAHSAFLREAEWRKARNDNYTTTTSSAPKCFQNSFSRSTNALNQVTSPENNKQQTSSWSAWKRRESRRSPKKQVPSSSSRIIFIKAKHKLRNLYELEDEGGREAGKKAEEERLVNLINSIILRSAQAGWSSLTRHKILLHLALPQHFHLIGKITSRRVKTWKIHHHKLKKFGCLGRFGNSFGWSLASHDDGEKRCFH